MLWEDQARSVVGGYFELFRLQSYASYADTPSNQANLIMVAMIGLAHLPECPAEFKEQAGRLVLDGVLGEVFGDVYLSLRELINE